MSQERKPFKSPQIDQLLAPLSTGIVKQRKKDSRGSTKLDYVEGWWAISEANRIFGFDAWDLAIVEMNMVCQRERQIGVGENRRPGWGVTYVARVMVEVNGIKREGVGAGHGIDADLGLAHESAVKEAATDALKRALVTFGNPFGLALYDKERVNVTNEAPDETYIGSHGESSDSPLTTASASAEDGSATSASAPIEDGATLERRFLDAMCQYGVDAHGIATLCHLWKIDDIMNSTETMRRAFLGKASHEYANLINNGRNMEGAIVLPLEPASSGGLRQAALTAFQG